MRLKNLSMSFGTQKLFKNINLYIGETEKIGIVVLMVLVKPHF
ncbi:MAG: hypothetical protein WCX96_04350 [Bacilli bacterium]